MIRQLCSLFMLLGVVSFAQGQSNESEINYQCREIRINQADNTVTLKGEVQFSDSKITIKDADEIIWDKTTNEIQVTGLKEYEMRGDSHLEILALPKKNILYYKLGNSIAYLR